MFLNCSFRILREIVGRRFLFSKFVLIKYKDNDGDLVIIICIDEFKMVEVCVDSILLKYLENDKIDFVGMLRLYIVEVNFDQELVVVEEEEIKGDESGFYFLLGDFGIEFFEIEVDNKIVDKVVKEILKEKVEVLKDFECKEVEMDDWLFEFVQLFRYNVGIDFDVYVDFYEFGMEFCFEVFEEIVISEEV